MGKAAKFRVTITTGKIGKGVLHDVVLALNLAAASFETSLLVFTKHKNNVFIYRCTTQ
jgi:hypothetical protein